MANSLFDIFGEHFARQGFKNVTRQPLSNNENLGKVITGPIKPNEPLKKGDSKKKSFLSNTGKALQGTPVRQVFTPRAVNVGALIYSDPDADDKVINIEEIEFTKPTSKYDNFHADIHDFLAMPLPDIAEQLSPPNTPPPSIKHSMSMEPADSYQDDFFTDDFSNDCIQDFNDDLGLPEIY